MIESGSKIEQYVNKDLMLGVWKYDVNIWGLEDLLALNQPPIQNVRQTYVEKPMARL